MLYILAGMLGWLAPAGLWVQAPQPPGQLIDIGGRRLHLHCMGTAAPTVVIENGSGAFSIDWALVQPAVASFTRVCTYDRAGHAWSDPGPIRDYPEAVIADLSVLLRTAHIAPPYVMVGASMGGIYVRDFQRHYPEQVAGMVLVDPTHDDGLAYTINDQEKVITDITREEMQAFMQALLARNPSPPPAPAKVSQPFDRLPAESQAMWLWAMGQYVGSITMQDVPFLGEATREEFIALKAQRLATPHPLDSLPLVVLVNGTRTKASAAKKGELAELSSNGTVVWAGSSCHEIHICSPELVIEAIRGVVTLARRSSKPGM